MEKTTMLICDGGVNTAEYLVQHNIRPNILILSYQEVMEQLPYIDVDTEVLIVVHSCTTFSQANIFALLYQLKLQGLKYEMFSNVKFDVQSPKFNYYFYRGDIITSDKEVIIMDKNIPIRVEKESSAYLQKYMTWNCEDTQVVYSEPYYVRHNEKTQIEQSIIQYKSFN